MECSDRNCPKHGTVSVRGRVFTGRVVKLRAAKSAVVEWPRIVKVPKYERVYKTNTRVMVHVPPCIKVREGDLVRIGETRKLSRTKSFVVLEVLSDGKKD